MRTRTVFLAAIAVLAAACSSSPTVATVNGEVITEEDVHALSAEASDDPVIDGDPFRDDLGLLIVNTALRDAAQEQFGVSGLSDPDRLAARINDPEDPQAALFEAVAQNEARTFAYAEGAALFFTVTDLVLDEIAPGEDINEPVGQTLFTEWFANAMLGAEIEVKPHVGFWDADNLSVSPPPPPG